MSCYTAKPQKPLPLLHNMRRLPFKPTVFTYLNVSVMKVSIHRAVWAMCDVRDTFKSPCKRPSSLQQLSTKAHHHIYTMGQKTFTFHSIIGSLGGKPYSTSYSSVKVLCEPFHMREFPIKYKHRTMYTNLFDYKVSFKH